MARLDPHSYADDAQPTADRLDWKADFDFDAKVISATATLTFPKPGRGPLDLDTRDLRIHAVTGDDGKPLPFELAHADPVLGAKLCVQLERPTSAVTLRYSTSPSATALGWLTPAQTAGKKHPFLFSQCQAIHARSVIPVQDTPRARMRYRAELTVPASLRALMGAGFIRREERGDRAVETWEMPQPIPPYLFALTVGDLQSRDLGARSRVWAEPATLEQAAYEFAEVEKMLSAAEKLFGPYEWDRFDFLVLPPSFPYGGMENPRLTFLTPTLLAGDRSLANVLAHELAHSWAGNLVTNANAEHFWLNEGLTVYAERRILEALEGRAFEELHAAIGRSELMEAIALFSDRPELTRLRTHLEGVDPDDAYSQIPYEKGYLFFRALEEAAGRERFDAFLGEYLRAFRFGTITTEAFAAFANERLPEAMKAIDAPRWFDEAGLPEKAPVAHSERLEAIERIDQAVPDVATAKAWTPTEWQLYLRRLKTPMPEATCRALDERFALTTSTNCEVLAAWLEAAVTSGWAPAVTRAEVMLGEVGRMKYLKPLYRALAERKETRANARALFERLRPGYHPIAVQVVDGMLRKHGV